jgi:ABC-type multidrug transport system fused ATPase/permease subunit
VLTAGRVARRRQYLTALLRQEMAFFDTHDTGALLARVVTDTNAIQLALCSKCPNLIHHGSAGIIGIIIGLARGWQMALVVCATLPLMGAPRLRSLPCTTAYTHRVHRRCRLRHGHVAAALDQDRVGCVR